LESYPTNGNPALFKAGAESRPIAFGDSGGQRALDQTDAIPMTMRRFDAASPSSATDMSTGRLQSEDTPNRRNSHRALVDQVMRELAVDADAASAGLNGGDALLAVAGLQWFLAVESRETVADRASGQRRRASRAGKK
jgi:hypothetical protein